MLPIDLQINLTEGEEKNMGRVAACDEFSLETSQSHPNEVQVRTWALRCFSLVFSPTLSRFPSRTRYAKPNCLPRFLQPFTHASSTLSSFPFFYPVKTYIINQVGRIYLEVTAAGELPSTSRYPTFRSYRLFTVILF